MLSNFFRDFPKLQQLSEAFTELTWSFQGSVGTDTSSALSSAFGQARPSFFSARSSALGHTHARRPRSTGDLSGGVRDVLAGDVRCGPSARLIQAHLVIPVLNCVLAKFRKNCQILTEMLTTFFARTRLKGTSENERKISICPSFFPETQLPLYTDVQRNVDPRADRERRQEPEGA